MNRWDADVNALAWQERPIRIREVGIKCPKCSCRSFYHHGYGHGSWDEVLFVLECINCGHQFAARLKGQPIEIGDDGSYIITGCRYDA